MNFLSLSSFFLLIILISTHLQKSLHAQSSKYETCGQTFPCGNMMISYPFYGGRRPDYCGYPGFNLSCAGPPQIAIMSQMYYVRGINTSTGSMTVARQDYWSNHCPTSLLNITMDFTLFSYTSTDANISLYYDCPSSLSTAIEANCNTNVFSGNAYFVTSSLAKKLNIQAVCSSYLFVPVLQSAADTIDSNASLGSVISALLDGFGLQWTASNDRCNECLKSGGQCGYDWDKKEPTCYCANQSNCPFSPSGPTKKKTIAIPVAAASVVGVAVLLMVLVLIRKATRTRDTQNIEAFLKNHGSLAPKRYTYRSIQKMTNNFRDKLGEGGYGGVYKGKLSDGRLVAVKLLKKLTGNGEDFINEVASISRTNHVNIVTFLGYYFQGGKRALVFEFMPNGSLDKFIHGKDTYQLLGLEMLFQIAIGIAKGLEYLHRGCNTRILHFDIKPHNILLDAEFQPKISDFGLSKLCPQKKSVILMSMARGTVGYIAPEVFCRAFGGVSHKSDGYSYGMMVLDMVGCRENAKTEISCSSQLYFPNWIYRKLEQGEERDNNGILNHEEQELMRKMIIVSLWCIQTNPANRPPVDKVVEMLKGTSSPCKFLLCHPYILLQGQNIIFQLHRKFHCQDMVCSFVVG
ncbi:hypothetical protein Ancab_034791 [Ancistrocladus abbreviatus]